ncbi:uncharacterized protein LOC135682795 [Rhopilema esculentum]|uniref:uncharacterized protein LOC135682795 n=1 Tax=Rhopilema esculentum TaxID=499914 RepID=UPI0031E17680
MIWIPIAAFLIAGAIGQSQNGSPIDVPVQFVTERHIFGDAFETNHFSAHLCGGCMFDKKLAVVALNLQKQPWNNTVQDILKATVTYGSGKIIASNNINGTYEEQISFVYHSSYGDLNIVVENGAGSGMIYTVALKFHAQTYGNPECEKRHLMSLVESRAHWKYRALSGVNAAQLHELVPIFKMSSQYSVKSSDLVFLQLDYCFPHIGNYNVTISVIAEDEESAFATYACTKSIKQCKTGNAPFHDTSGSAANTVQVRVAGAPDIGPITVIVRGDGRYLQMNTFSLAASKYIEL